MNATSNAEARKTPGRKPAWPKIRERFNREGSKSYRVDAGRFDGKKRLVKQFPTLQEAEAYAATLREQRAGQREANKFELKNRAVSLANLTDTQRGDVLKAYERLKGGRVASLLAAVEFFLKHSGEGQEKKSLRTVVAEYLERKEKANRRPKTIADARQRLAGLVALHGERDMFSITTHDIEAYMDGLNKVSSVTKDNYRRAFSSLFAYGVKRKLCASNPVEAIEVPTHDKTAPRILTPKEAKRLLTAAKAHPEMLPYFAVGLLAGLRPENELRNLTWDRIDMKAGHIHVTAATSKTHRDRYVDIAPSLRAWLNTCRKSEGRIFFSRRAFRKVLDAAKIDWTPDVMRHSFGSYHLVAHNDAARTSLQLGHLGNPAMLFRHYRALVKAKEAETFWKIMPPRKTGQIIQMNMRASA